MKWKTSLVTALAALSFLIGCSTAPTKEVSERVGSVLTTLNLNPSDGWVALKSPLSTGIMDVGSLLEIQNGDPAFIGFIHKDPACIPESAWQIVTSKAPKFEQNRKIDYGFSLGKSLGIDGNNFLGISVGRDGDEPEFSTTITLDSVIVKTVNKRLASRYLGNNYASLDNYCKEEINSDSKFIISTVYVVNDGKLSFKDKNGVQINLNDPTNAEEKEKFVSLGLSVEDDGSVTFKDKDIVVAIKAADFTKELESLGVEPKANPVDVRKKLIDANSRLTTSDNTARTVLYGLVGFAGIATLVALIIKDPPEATTREVTFNIRPPTLEQGVAE